MKYTKTKLLAVVLAAFALMAGSCPSGQPTEATQIKLAEVGIVINKSINEGVKGLREAKGNGLISNEHYVIALDRAEGIQNIADGVNKALDRWSTIDSTNKAAVLDALAFSAGEFDKIIADPKLVNLPSDLANKIRGFAQKAKATLSIAAGVVGLITAPTKTSDIVISLKGVK